MLASLLRGKKGREGRGRTLSWETPAEALQDGLGLCRCHRVSKAHGAGEAHGIGVAHSEVHGIDVAHNEAHGAGTAHGVHAAHGAEPPQEGSAGGQGIAASPLCLRGLNTSDKRGARAPSSTSSTPSHLLAREPQLPKCARRTRTGVGGEAAFCVGVLVG